MKNWKTTLVGTIFAILTFLQSNGVKVGRVGNTDFVAIGVAAAAAALGAVSKDSNVTGGTVEQGKK